VSLPGSRPPFKHQHQRDAGAVHEAQTCHISKKRRKILMEERREEWDELPPELRLRVLMTYPRSEIRDLVRATLITDVLDSAEGERSGLIHILVTGWGIIERPECPETGLGVDLPDIESIRSHWGDISEGFGTLSKEIWSNNPTPKEAARMVEEYLYSTGGDRVFRTLRCSLLLHPDSTFLPYLQRPEELVAAMGAAGEFSIFDEDGEILPGLGNEEAVWKTYHTLKRIGRLGDSNQFLAAAVSLILLQETLRDKVLTLATFASLLTRASSEVSSIVEELKPLMPLIGAIVRKNFESRSGEEGGPEDGLGTGSITVFKPPGGIEC